MIPCVEEREMHRPWALDGERPEAQARMGEGCIGCRYRVGLSCTATDGMAQCKRATPANLARTLAAIIYERARPGSREQMLLVGVIERALLDAVGAQDPPTGLLDQGAMLARQYLTGAQGRMDAELAGVDGDWYAALVRRFFLAVAAMPHPPQPKPRYVPVKVRARLAQVERETRGRRKGDEKMLVVTRKQVLAHGVPERAWEAARQAKRLRPIGAKFYRRGRYFQAKDVAEVFGLPEGWQEERK